MFHVFMLGFSFFGWWGCFFHENKKNRTNLDKYFIGTVSSFRVYFNDVLTQNEVRMFKQVESLQ